jgi:hypothetical protein
MLEETGQPMIFAAAEKDQTIGMLGEFCATATEVW